MSLNGMTFGLLRRVFRCLPIPQKHRDRLRNWFFATAPSIRPSVAIGKPPRTTAHRAIARADSPAIGHVASSALPLPNPLPATLVAFYLPQFHRIRENDAWWGRGFTEWRNVARALPQFEGHTQPRAPGDLGFYDLRDGETMREQAALAHQYGIGAFCFYYYWFQGRTLLESPVENWLNDSSITLPYCLCWANESWSRRWDGRPGDILVEQSHDPDDDIAFISHVARYLRDPRYLRVDGLPLLLIYRAELLPDPQGSSSRWRKWCNDNGIGPITLACVQSFERFDPRQIGFDAAVEFPPNLSSPPDITARQRLINPNFSGQVLDWRQLPSEYCGRPIPPYRLFPAVNCGWDNEPRRPGRGRVYLHASPRKYRDWLFRTVQNRLGNVKPTDRLVFVNAWNEWAEGAILEPDMRLGHAWLHATREALIKAGEPVETPLNRPCVVVHAWDPVVFDEILSVITSAELTCRLVVTTSTHLAARMQDVLNQRGMTAELVAGENRGRDVLPFLHVADRLLHEGEDIVLKLHTKQSTHREDGAIWRRELLSRLLAPERASGIFDAFGSDDGIGMVAPEGHIQPLELYWGANQERVEYLATRIGIPAPRVHSDTFVAGSMFWVRLEALRPLLDAHLDPWEFESESGQVDGTAAHAIERLFSLCVRASGHQVLDAATVCGQAAINDVGRYRYAKKGCDQ